MNQTMYWWDFDNHGIIVESNNKKYPIVKIFEFNENADFAITQAEELISDLKAGRVNVKEVFLK